MSNAPKVIEDFFVKLKRRRMLKRALIGLKWLFYAFLFLILTTWILVQNPRFQNYVINKITSYLSQELDTRVTIEKIDLDLFDNVLLENFYIEDQSGDTLFYSEKLNADLSTSLLALLNRQLVVEEISLENAWINIGRDTTDWKNNFQFILDYFKKEKKEPENKPAAPRKPFLVDLKRLNLKNIHFVQDDIVAGKKFTVLVDEGSMVVEELNLKESYIYLESVELQGPDVIYEENEAIPLPEYAIKVKNELEADSLKQDFTLKMDHFILGKGRFELHNFRKAPVKTTADDILDWKHLNVFDIGIAIDSFQYAEEIFTGEVNKITLKESSGFVLDSLSSKKAVVSNEQVDLNDLKLVTPYSNLGEKLVLKFSTFKDFKDFNNEVYMIGEFDNAVISIRDILTFAPKLRNNRFFKDNIAETLQINGKIQGRVNRLGGSDLAIRLGKNTYINGDFNSRELSVKDSELLNLKLTRLETSIKTLRQLVPGFTPPSNFDALGRFTFSGSFDGFFHDFVAYGELNSDLGTAKMDMNMDLTSGRELANYSGNLSLINFDLKKWTGNNDLGIINFSSTVENGTGLTLETVDANMKANISQFNYKGYAYENIDLDGTLTKNLFDGQLSVEEENIDFKFNGKINFEDELPSFNFSADIKKLDLKALNLTKEDYVTSGAVNLDLTGNNFSTMQGMAKLKHFRAIKNGEERFELDSVLIISKLTPDSVRNLVVESEILKVWINGIFDIKEIALSVTKYLDNNFPKYAERFNLFDREKTVKDSRYQFRISIPDSKNFTGLLSEDLDTLRGIFAEGNVDNIDDRLSLRLNVPHLSFKNLDFDTVFFDLNSVKSRGNIDFSVAKTSINNKQQFDFVSLNGKLRADTINFTLKSFKISKVFEDLSLNGKLFLVDEFFQVQFMPSNLIILKDRWEIVRDNYIRFGKGLVETKNFDLQNYDKRIVIENVEDAGLTMSLENFDLSVIDEVWDYDKLDFGGKFYVLLEVGNIYELKDFFATAIADTLYLNGDPFGELRADVAMGSLSEKIEAQISIIDRTQRLVAEGIVSPIKKDPEKPVKHDFEMDLSLENYPLGMMEYFIRNGISNTQGTLDADVDFNGKFNKPNIDGFAYISNMGVTIDYLQTRYTAPTGKIKINNYLIDATNNMIYDSLGNTALITDGITHDHLKDFKLDVTIESNKFLFLNTKKGDNELYYGYGLGSGEVNFSGPFNKTDITINAETGPKTRLEIPISYDQDASEVSFIKFIDKDGNGEIEGRSKVDLRGVAVNMNLSVTPDAEVLLIFDEKAGDIIRGSGTGDLQIEVTRTGDFNMYGNYEIERGEYLFTFMNFINKPFTVKRGGQITWDGDPFGAQINIEAEYADLKKPVYNFILEYLQDENAKAEARSPTNIELTMKLKGDLMKPDIIFDLDFPNLTGEIQNYTDSKLRTIRQDQNELNRQVFGLIVVGGFLPNQSTFIQGTEGLIGINTLSELLSNQLSIYLTELISEVFTDVGFISGVDFQVNWNVYQADETFQVEGGRPTIVTGNELELTQRFDLFNDRFSIDLGGSYISQGGAFFAGDLIMEYFLDKKRRFKVRFYQLSDQTLEGRRNKTGLGFSVRKEFDSFEEFIKGMKKTASSGLKENN